MQYSSGLYQIWSNILNLFGTKKARIASPPTVQHCTLWKLRYKYFYSTITVFVFLFCSKDILFISKQSSIGTPLQQESDEQLDDEQENVSLLPATELDNLKI